MKHFQFWSTNQWCITLKVSHSIRSKRSPNKVLMCYSNAIFRYTFTLLLLVIIILQGAIPKRQLWQILLCLSIYLPIYLSIRFQGGKARALSFYNGTWQLTQQLGRRIGEQHILWVQHIFYCYFRLFKYRLFVT